MTLNTNLTKAISVDLLVVAVAAGIAIATTIAAVAILPAVMIIVARDMMIMSDEATEVAVVVSEMTDTAVAA